jgi:S-adenosylmethionine decarboxylase proenzyme
MLLSPMESSQTAIITIQIDQIETELCNDISISKIIITQIAKELDYKIVGEEFHQFKPQGNTGVLLLATSHISIHTWPENNYAIIEILTCTRIPENARKIISDIVKSIYIDCKLNIKIIDL